MVFGSGKPKVPRLVDKDGYLWHSVAEVITHASLDDLETEIRVQIDKALAMGIKTTHLDSHMGTCFHPAFFERYVKAGIEKKIPVPILFGTQFARQYKQVKKNF